MLRTHNVILSRALLCLTPGPCHHAEPEAFHERNASTMSSFVTTIRRMLGLSAPRPHDSTAVEPQVETPPAPEHMAHAQSPELETPSQLAISEAPMATAPPVESTAVPQVEPVPAAVAPSTEEESVQAVVEPLAEPTEIAEPAAVVEAAVEVVEVDALPLTAEAAGEAGSAPVVAEIISASTSMPEAADLLAAPMAEVWMGDSEQSSTLSPMAEEAEDSPTATASEAAGAQQETPEAPTVFDPAAPNAVSPEARPQQP